METEFLKRMKELADRCYNSDKCVFSDFLNLSEITELNAANLNFVTIDYDGGAEFAERKMARFSPIGGFLVPFPIAIVKVIQPSAKFAETLSHRDFLGAMMNNLGIERSKTGDIFTDNRNAFIVCTDKIAAFMVDNLESVGRAKVKCEIADFVPNEYSAATEIREFPVASVRLDAIISQAYKISRESSLELFRQKKVSVCGKIEENNSYSPKIDEVISVRGFGKFIFKCIGGNSKKGKTYITIEIFI